MISLFKYNLDSNLLAKSHSYELFTIEDRRYTTMIDVVKKYKNTEKNIAFIEVESLLIKCLTEIHTTNFSKDYDKVIIWASELYWDNCDDEDTYNNVLNDNVHIIFNFFRADSPYNLNTKSYCSIGSFGDITQMYLDKYNFESRYFRHSDYFEYNLISKFGRPNSHRIELYNELKDLPNFVYSINNFPYVEDDGQVVSKKFESENDLTGDFKSYHLPDEDFESFSELITETRLSTYENSKRLISATEKTLKGFMFKRPNITLVQPEVYSYLETFGFKFPNILGMDSKTQQLEICKQISLLSQTECKQLSLQNKDVYESNFNTLVDFLKYHRNKFDEIVKEIIYDN